MTNITYFEYFKKRWLYYLSLVFIFILPLAIITEKFVRMDPVKSYAKVSFSGLVLGMVYIIFIAKKLKKKINDMKFGAVKIFLNGVSNIIPFLTVGFLVVLVESTLKAFNITVFAICGSMFFGTILQIIEFMINKRFLYELKIEEMAREEFDKKKKIKELEMELENEH